jgi:hypothetical protein
MIRQSFRSSSDLLRDIFYRNVSLSFPLAMGRVRRVPTQVKVRQTSRRRTDHDHGDLPRGEDEIEDHQTLETTVAEH